MADHIGPYRLIERLGSGAMGTAFRAEDTRDGRLVAVKLLHPHLLGDAEAVRRLQREAGIAGRLDHPNIARVTDSGNEGDQYYVVMELVEGETLHDLLRREVRLSEAETQRIMLAVARALEAAHAEGVIHRDVKPGNILLARDGRIVVSDFGVARGDEYSTMTAHGGFVGTPVYAAPEALAGQTDTRSDLYSLGVMAYEAMTGAGPAVASAGSSSRRASLGGRELRVLRRVAPALQPIISRLLETDPARRYQEPREVVEALDALPPLETTIVAEPTLARPALGRAQYHRRPRPADFTTWWPQIGGLRTGAAVAVLAIAGALLAVFLLRREGAAVDAPPVIATGSGWRVYESNWKALDEDTWARDLFASRGAEVPLGSQVVCLGTDEACKLEYTAYSYSGDVVWEEIPGAQWIWAFGIKPQSPAADAAYFFEKEFEFDGAEAKRRFRAELTFAFDNGIRTFIDGNELREGQHVDPGTAQTVDVTSLIGDGPAHTVVFWGVNAPCETPCTYQQEPAGIIAKIDFVER